MTAPYPVYLDLENRPCAVLGGDEMARDKALGLLRAGARVTVIAADLCAGLADRVEAEEVAWERRAPRGSDVGGGWRLVIDASGDPDINQEAWTEAERLGVLLNVVDRPAQCHFIAPAVVRRGPLQIAISTSGESPYLAAALRARLERLVGEEWGSFVSLAGRVRRRLRGDGVAIEQQTAVYARLLRSDVRALLRQGDTDAAERAATAIAAGAGSTPPGRVTLVGAGPGAPGLLTLAGSELLAGADMVFHDALVDPGTLALCGPGAELVDVGKRGGRKNPDQGEITARMARAAREGLDVVRLKGGDPFIFGRGGEEVAGLVAAGIDVAVVPGVSSASAAPTVAGIPLTLRGVASSVAFTTGHEGGAGDPSRLGSIARAVDTLVILMPLAGLDGLTAQLRQALRDDHPVALVCGATLRNQHVLRSTLGELVAAAQQAPVFPPAILIVGRVVAAARAQGIRSRLPF